MTPSTHRSLISRGSTQADTGSVGVPRYQSLKRAIAQTQSRINDHRRLISSLQQQFNGLIRPLEVSMTTRVLELTHTLINHHDESSLSVSDKSVLGLWIGDNIASLTQHPFADAHAAHELALRWRASLKAEALGTATANAVDRSGTKSSRETCGCADDANDGQADRPDPVSQAHQTRFTSGSSDDPQSNKSGDEPPPRETGSDVQKNSVETDVLIAQLFRQLAAVLHPDREPDEQRKQIKDALMIQCLRAREDGDLATLLSLHAEHVGGDELLSENAMAHLVTSLERQLRALQQYLRQLHFGDTLQTMMIERYAGHSDQETARRFSRHAESLRVEIQRLQQLQRALSTTAGLDATLQSRRNELLDHMAINEMTGL